ncbi:MAG: F0F1 ATP synthase subunit delta [Clostridiales bacterium]|nr:F0F1 ATP synthase subunit delta [Clostridiales bacterium]
MSQTAECYAKIMLEKKDCVRREDVAALKELCQTSGAFIEALENPFVGKDEKNRIIERLVPDSLQVYVKQLRDDGSLEQIDAVCQEYERLYCKEHGIITGVLEYVFMPDENQLDGIRSFLKKEFHTKQVELILKENKKLIGGFTLTVEGQEYDMSIRERIRLMNRALNRGGKVGSC